MYNYMDATSAAGSAIFFILVVVLGSFIAMNLVLAQIMFSFLEEDMKTRLAALNEKRQMQAITAMMGGNVENEDVPVSTPIVVIKPDENPPDKKTNPNPNKDDDQLKIRERSKSRKAMKSKKEKLETDACDKVL